MKAFTITLVFCLFSFATLAADTTIVKLMRGIIDLEVSPSYQYYYLANKAANPYFNDDEIDAIATGNPEIPRAALREILMKIKTDTSAFYWSEYNFPKARCVDEKHLPKVLGMLYNVIYLWPNTIPADIDKFNQGNDNLVVLIDPDASKRKKSLATSKALAALDNRPIEEKNYFRFSKPVFSADKQYVLISTGQSNKSCTYILKNNNGNWQVVYKSSVVA